MTLEHWFKEVTPPIVARRLRRSRLPKVGVRPLHNLDEKLSKVLPEKGTYVEIGANDGLTQSNTWWLERDRGWSGLLIEPALNRFIELRANRGDHNRFACAACVSFDYPNSFVPMTYADLMTTTDGVELADVDRDEHHQAAMSHARHQVRFLAVAMHLSRIIDEAQIGPDIDFFSLDVEGAELAVLGGIDFSRHRFRRILVETRDLDRVRLVLDVNGYSYVDQLSVHDHLFEFPEW